MSNFELFTLCTKDNRSTIISLVDKGYGVTWKF